MTGEPDDVDSMVEPVVPSRHRWLAGLLAARPADRVVDLGCGTGGTLAQVAPAVPGGLVAGLDLSAGALARAAEAVGEAVAGQERPPAVLLVQADLTAPLPLAEAGFDRVVCHNVLEVLPDHGALLAEAVRLLRPGGRLVLAHSDFDTLVFASEDLELTRRLVRDYCDTQQPWMAAVDGTIGRRLADIAGRAGLEVEDARAAVVLGRRFRPGEIGWGYARNLADTLIGGGRADPAELDRWLAGLQRLDDRGAFLFSVNDYAVICGRTPGDVHAGAAQQFVVSSSDGESMFPRVARIFVGVAVVLGTRLWWPSRPMAWYLIAGGQLLFSIGDAFSSYHEWVLGVEVPFSSVAA